MQKGAIKDLTYGGLMELINDKSYYYYSPVGRDYCHLTEDGKTAVVEFMNMIAWKMKEAENADLERRAKEQVMNALKGKE